MTYLLIYLLTTKNNIFKLTLGNDFSIQAERYGRSGLTDTEALMEGISSVIFNSLTKFGHAYTTLRQSDHLHDAHYCRHTVSVTG